MSSSILVCGKDKRHLQMFSSSLSCPYTFLPIIESLRLEKTSKNIQPIHPLSGKEPEGKKGHGEHLSFGDRTGWETLRVTVHFPFPSHGPCWGRAPPRQLGGCSWGTRSRSVPSPLLPALCPALPALRHGVSALCQLPLTAGFGPDPSFVTFVVTGRGHVANSKQPSPFPSDPAVHEKTSSLI